MISPESVDAEKEAAAHALEQLGALLRRSKKGSVLVVDFRPCAGSCTDATLDHLARLGTVREVYLAGTAVTDEGLLRLGALEKLDTLDLQGTTVSDAGLAALPSFAHLKLLLLNATRVTRDGVKQLRQTRIGTRIVCEIR